MNKTCDLVIIGGGINGCGCAADAAQRGLSVLLCEQGDLASGTSSQSSKLIHGGLRYLEFFDFALVKKALKERSILLKVAPHLVRPLAFFIPHEKSSRAAWLIKLGLFLYDNLSRKVLPASCWIRKKLMPSYFTPLRDNIKEGALFYDARTDDARLTVTNALQAAAAGAVILPRTRLLAAITINSIWHLTLQSEGGAPYEVTARAVINATGPWLSNTSRLLNITLKHAISLVKGSHIIVKKLYDGEHAYLLQNDDGRIVFVIPYYNHSLVGTTDVALPAMPAHVEISADEKVYLQCLIKRYFQAADVTILHSYSGVRLLLDVKSTQASRLSRDYIIDFAAQNAPSVTIYGGKLTTYRQLAEEAIDALRGLFPDLPLSRTSVTPLPGASFGTMNFTEYQQYALSQYSWMDKATLARYLTTYGTRTENILAKCACLNDLGLCLAPTLYMAEIKYLLQEEWVTTYDDLARRISGLDFMLDSTERCEIWKRWSDSMRSSIKISH